MLGRGQRWWSGSRSPMYAASFLTPSQSPGARELPLGRLASSPTPCPPPGDLRPPAQQHRDLWDPRSPPGSCPPAVAQYVAGPALSPFLSEFSCRCLESTRSALSKPLGPLIPWLTGSWGPPEVVMARVLNQGCLILSLLPNC